MRLARPVLAFVLAAAVVAPAGAAPREQAEASLKQLYRMALSAEVCGFKITDKQADAIGKAMDRDVEVLDLTDDKADALYLEVEKQMEAEGWDTLCAEGGAWAKEFRDRLAGFTR